MNQNDVCYGYYKICIDDKLSLIYADEGYYELHGYCLEDRAVLDCGTLEHIHPDDVDMVMNTIRDRIRNQNQTFTYKFRIITSEGRISHIVRGCRISTEDSRIYITGMDCSDIEAEVKREPVGIQAYEIDALTDTFTREAFISRVDRLLKADGSAAHAFLMVDLDGFKAVNDIFGHAAGDKILYEMSNSLKSVLRQDDLIGRLGGDEFMICITNIQYVAAVEKKAGQICSILRRNLGENVIVSGSLGITMFPRDGDDFDELYKKTDVALYKAKSNGKDNYVFYSNAYESERVKQYSVIDEDKKTDRGGRKTRMLIIDNDTDERSGIEEIFNNEYHILKSYSGKNALSIMRCYRSGIEIVIMDMDMYDMNGFQILESMMTDKDISGIPVIMMSSSRDIELEQRIIAAGASDFVRKPLDECILKTRVQNIVNRVENERLRVQNSYLLLQEDEEERYRQVLQATGTVVFTYDWVHGVYTYDPLVSRYIKGNFDKRSLWQIFLSEMTCRVLDVKTMSNLVISVAGDRNCESAEMNVQLKNPENDWRWFRMQIIKMKDTVGINNKLLLTFNDITDKIEAELKLQTRAECDSLTGLYNRETFMEKAQALISSKRDTSFIISCFDIENFKTINDQYGQEMGNKLLMAIGEFIRVQMGSGNLISCRVNADDFTCLFNKATGSICDELYASLMEELRYTFPALDIIISEGRYYIDDRRMSINTMYDKAMYAKRQVKGRYDTHTAVYNSLMERSVQLRQDIITMMERAIKEQQIEIYYQPQINHLTGMISGAEALVRWNHPNRGFMSPNEFIPIFETNGFIYRLDRYVWENACKTYRQWMDEDICPPYISVNVSRYDLLQKDFFERLTDIVRRYGVPTSCLRIEITETAFAGCPEVIIDVVRRLKNYGFIVQIDDFGSGYSSLNTLKDVPTDVIKLDMKFLSGEDTLGRRDDILGYIIRMASSIGLDVIAEGVETNEQAECLLRYDCSIMQGYLYAMPMPISSFEEMLRNCRAIST